MNRAFLLVEDSSDDYILMERAFRKTEIPVLMKWVKDGHEAISYLSGEGKHRNRDLSPWPALVISDIKMPQMGGFELLAWMRTMPAVQRIPFIMLSSSNHRTDINRAYDLGANSYLVKPGSFVALTQAVHFLKRYWLQVNQPPRIG